MIESICAEVLLSGLQWIGNKSLDFDERNKYFIKYPNQTTYVIPDVYSLTENTCQSEKFSSKIEKSKMKKFLVTLN